VGLLAGSLLLSAAVGCAHEQGSIGAMLARSRTTGRVTVRSVPPGTGQRAGLEPGDEIVAIDGKDVHALGSEDEVRRALRGDVGTKVKLTVVRDGVRRDVVVERGGGLMEK
jgi:C-terminal processing protease CtpA/Prc